MGWGCGGWDMERQNENFERTYFETIFRMTRVCSMLCFYVKYSRIVSLLLLSCFIFNLQETNQITHYILSKMIRKTTTAQENEVFLLI